EQPALLPPSRRLLHDRGGVPLAEHHEVALADEPLVEQVQLRALTRAIDALDDEEAAGEPQVTTHRHPTVAAASFGTRPGTVRQGPPCATGRTPGPPASRACPGRRSVPPPHGRGAGCALSHRPGPAPSRTWRAGAGRRGRAGADTGKHSYPGPRLAGPPPTATQASDGRSRRGPPR